MAFLKEAHQALTDLSANRQQSFGLHLADEIRAGRSGLLVGEVPFDPARHNVADINHMSLMAEAVGVPYVRQVVPSHPLAVNLIVHHRPGSSHPAIERAKQLLAASIRQSIVESKPNATDWIHSYLIGEVEEGLTEFDVIDSAPKDSRRIIRTLAELCSTGLGILISDFENLDLTDAKRRNFVGSVALKFNYGWELELPNRGIWTLGGGTEVDVRKKKDFERFNHESRQRHDAIRSQLARVGFAVAQVSFDPNLYVEHDQTRPGFDTRQVDRAIASTIRLATKQQA